MPRYSGPALAAGAISKAIGEMFEGLLAGQQGGLEARKVIGSEGRAEREMLMKAHTLPQELAALQAQTALARAQTGKIGQETTGMRTLLPGQVRGQDADIDLTGARTRELQTLTGPRAENIRAGTDQTRAQTDYLRGPQTAQTQAQTRQADAQTGYITGPQTRHTDAQTQHLGAQTGLVNQQVRTAEQNYNMTQAALNDFRRIQAQAALENRPVNEKDLINLMYNHPVLLRGADDIPSGALFNLSMWDARIKELSAKATNNLILEKFMADRRQEAQKSAADLTKTILGVEELETGNVDHGALHQWFAKQQYNAALKAAFPGQAPFENPGVVPARIRDYIFQQIKARAGSALPETVLHGLAYGAADLMQYESMDIEQAISAALVPVGGSTESPGSTAPGHDMEYDPDRSSFGSLPNMP